MRRKKEELKKMRDRYDKIEQNTQSLNKKTRNKKTRRINTNSYIESN
jgi:hypothetical protein